MVLPSMRTVSAFFSSMRFLTVHACVIHAIGLVMRLRRIVMLVGTRFGMLGSLPPNMMFSPAASR